MDSALDSELDSALDSGFDSDSALELPDVLDDADEELLVLWEELLPELPEELPEDELLELPELAEEDEADVLPEEPALDEDELLAGADSLDTPLPMLMVRVLLLTLQSSPITTAR